MALEQGAGEYVAGGSGRRLGAVAQEVGSFVALQYDGEVGGNNVPGLLQVELVALIAIGIPGAEALGQTYGEGQAEGGVAGLADAERQFVELFHHEGCGRGGVGG